MKGAVLFLLVACVPTRPSPEIDGGSLPAGVWEIAPGSDPREPVIVADGPDVWFGYTRIHDAARREVWLAKTTSSGSSLTEPMLIEAGRSPSIDIGDGLLALASRNIESGEIRLALFDSDATLVASNPAALAQPFTWWFRVVAAHGPGMLSILSTHESQGAEVVASSFDRAAELVGTLAIAPPEDGESKQLAAARRGNGDVAVAWLRDYDQCVDTRPDLTLTSSVTLTTAATPRSVSEARGPSRGDPSVAARGAAAYVAWPVDLQLRTMISLARFDDVSTVVAEIGDPTAFNLYPMLALAESGRGAIAWQTDDPPEIRVAALGDDGASVTVGPSHVFPLERRGADALRGFVHVGDDNFVVAWSEHREIERLYARLVDLSEPPPPAPSSRPQGTHSGRARLRPCSH